MQSANAVCVMQSATAVAPAPVSAPSAPAQAPAPEPNAARALAPAPFAQAAPLAALINPKKGAGLINFGNVNAALSNARLAWTYNWWYSLVGVELHRPCLSLHKYLSAHHSHIGTGFSKEERCCGQSWRWLD